MTKWLVIPLVTILLVISACIPLSSTDVATITETQSNLMVSIDNLQKTTDEMVAANLITQEQAAKINTEIDKVQDNVAMIVKGMEGKEGLAAVKGLVTASTPINPYAVPMLVAINIIEALAIWNEKKKVTGLKKGVARATGESNTEDAKRIYDTVKASAKGLLGQQVM